MKTEISKLEYDIIQEYLKHFRTVRNKGLFIMIGIVLAEITYMVLQVLGIVGYSFFKDLACIGLFWTPLIAGIAVLGASIFEIEKSLPNYRKDIRKYVLSQIYSKGVNFTVALFGILSCIARIIILLDEAAHYDNWMSWVLNIGRVVFAILLTSAVVNYTKSTTEAKNKAEQDIDALIEVQES